MVDLMMWLVIAALLLAAAIQGIGYYQKAAYLYQMKSDLTGAGQNTVAKQGQAYDPGKLDEATVTEAAADTRWTANMAYSVEMDASNSKPFIRATHPGIDDRDGIYLFESCGEVFKVGVNIIAKGTSPDLGTCSTVTTPVDVVVGPPAPDKDGDGIPDATDPDIDGDGVPNGDDPTPNGETTTPPPGGDTGGTTPVVDTSAKCYDANADTEATCWMTESVTAQNNYESANGTYFGGVISWSSYSTDRPFNAPELADLKSPLVFKSIQSNYRDSEYPEDDNNYAQHKLVARDGEIWQTELTHYLDSASPYVSGPTKTGKNTNYACKFVTPADIYGECTLIGRSSDAFRVDDLRPNGPVADKDATAMADIEKVITAQYNYIKANGTLYGTYDTTVDVAAFAGTTYPAKVSNFLEVSKHYTRVMVTAPNGDLYTAQFDFHESNFDTSYGNPRFIYRYSSTHVNDVCSRPFTNNYNQFSDIRTCKAFGYNDFHG